MSSLSNKGFQNPEQPAFSLIAYREAWKHTQLRVSKDACLVLLGLPFSPFEKRIEQILKDRGFGYAPLPGYRIKEIYN